MIISNILKIVNDPLHFDSLLIWNPIGEPNLNIYRIKRENLEKIKDVNYLNSNKRLHQNLKNLGIVFEDYNELSLLKNKSLTTTSSKVSRIVIMTSSFCQLGCNNSDYGAYCGQEHEKFNVNLIEVEKVMNKVRRMISSSRKSSIELVFFGGEPLVNLGFLIEVMNRAKGLEQNNKVAIQGRVISNGLLLTSKMYQKLVDIGISYFEITLDGTQAVHDSRRPRKSGYGSFDKILSNLVSISPIYCPENGEVVIRCNVDSRNEWDVFNLLGLLNESKVVPLMGFYVAPIRNWGNNKAKDNFENRDRFSKLEIKVFSWLLRNGLTPLLIPENAERSCIASADEPCVFAPDGNWYSCTEMPLVSKNHIKGSDRTWDDLDREGWYKAVAKETLPCTKCHFSSVCAGACPKDWLEGNIPCPSYVDNYSDRIKLFSTSMNSKVINLDSIFYEGGAI
ncbi:SPASM domain-containing protein [Vibrio natriegens]|uniref:radical SAM/SPASM domain-containing protein n=1 Tax=Vibrio natriegens TaxID=691 RepID=UPI001EFC9E3C|nr:SPASM domain-containing protein [Vibrio natriegens]MCG9700812.1 SPASM domain-containing protein [Vibrio natriegens]